MQIENKLILCSILAISIGIATVTQSVYLITLETAQSTNQAIAGVHKW